MNIILKLCFCCFFFFLVLIRTTHETKKRNVNFKSVQWISFWPITTIQNQYQWHFKQKLYPIYNNNNHSSIQSTNETSKYYRKKFDLKICGSVRGKPKKNHTPNFSFNFFFSNAMVLFLLVKEMVNRIQNAAVIKSMINICIVYIICGVIWNIQVVGE